MQARQLQLDYPQASTPADVCHRPEVRRVAQSLSLRLCAAPTRHRAPVAGPPPPAPAAAHPGALHGRRSRAGVQHCHWLTSLVMLTAGCSARVGLVRLAASACTAVPTSNAVAAQLMLCAVCLKSCSTSYRRSPRRQQTPRTSCTVPWRRTPPPSPPVAAKRTLQGHLPALQGRSSAPLGRSWQARRWATSTRRCCGRRCDWRRRPPPHAAR